VFRDQPKSAPSLACAMYMRGAYDALLLWDPFWQKVCVPDAFSTATLASTVLDYASAHQDKVSDMAAAPIKVVHRSRGRETAFGRSFCLRDAALDRRFLIFHVRGDAADRVRGFSGTLSTAGP
jgi:Rap1a immunity proteins